MSLSAGTKLGPYEIQAPLGAGGMGEVYRARDTRLERTVAIKVLPEHLSTNPESKQRFEREARSISSLNHPNICALYDIGNQDGVDFLVMEYLEGQTLAERLQKGTLPIEQVLKIGIEIADGLDKAHRQGIVHRDLKPGNIMLTKSGAKLMDFGLAKPAEAAFIASASVGTPTLSNRLTVEGTIVGTFQYMAPEQLEGKDADARSDIFAFGALLYEMATGKPAFDGKTPISVLAAIVEKEPEPLGKLKPMTPPGLDHVVMTCLAKNPENRFQCTHDVAVELKWISQASSLVTPPPATGRKRQWIALAASALFVVGAVVLGWWRLRPGGESDTQLVTSIPPPQGAVFLFTTDFAGPPVLSPDGRRIAFVATLKSRNELWIRSLESDVAQVVPATEDARFPFWSPDSQWVGFFTRSKLKKVDIKGDPPLELCDAPEGRGGTWSREGTILFTPDVVSGLDRIAASGGSPTAVLQVDRPKHTSLRWPYFLPDGRHFLYLALNHNSRENTAIYYASIDGKENRLLLHSDKNVAYASGYLLFLQEETLMAQPFDPERGALSGDPARVVSELESDGGTWYAVFSASDTGMLAYRPRPPTAGAELMWVDRSGRRSATGLERERYGSLRLSPDAQRLAAEIENPRHDIWVYDLRHGTGSRFTFNPGLDLGPVWSPDGKYIVYSSDRGGRLGDLYIKPSAGTSEEHLLLGSPDSIKTPQDWSRDGKYLLYSSSKLGGSPDLWALPMFGAREPFPFVHAEQEASFSPDGKWVAYSSDESGRMEVYVSPFSPPTAAERKNSSGPGKWQISSSGGSTPAWRNDGREIVFLEHWRLMVAEVDTRGAEFKVESVRSLFQLDGRPTGYDLTPDAKRFLVALPDKEAAAQPITLALNWTLALKRK